MPAKRAKKKTTGRSTSRKRSPAARRASSAPARRLPASRGRGLRLTAVDVMAEEVITVRPSTTADEVSSLFQFHNINGAPVVDDDGYLVGIVTEDDLIFGRMGSTDERPAGTEKGGLKAVEPVLRVADIMTPNPISAEEATPVESLCMLMWRLKIHRIPIVKEGRVSGIVSSLDICRLVAEERGDT